MTKLSGWKMAAALFLLCAGVAAPAQDYDTLINFNGSNGVHPEYMSVTQGREGKLYGTTWQGGNYGNGTVFKVSAAGKLTTLHSFNISDGAFPASGLVLGTDGNFYGTTNGGGANNCYLGCGTVFKITAQGALTTLYRFCVQLNCTDGAQPYSGLVQGIDGNFYGATQYGGANGDGTFFRITSTGVLTVLHSFGGADGIQPVATPAQATDGNFYGTTYRGGAYGLGTVFKVSSRGQLTVLHSFDFGTDGDMPLAGLVQVADGIFYGATSEGGATGNGTIFSISSDGTFTTLHSFDFYVDGAYPSAAPVQATDRKFYGTTSNGGVHVYYGTVFQMRCDGSLTTLLSFNGTDGSEPVSQLIQATNGKLYGTTYGGGTNNDGTVFSADVGLGPFVAFVQAAGKVGKTAQILGQGFTGTTSVSFNGTPANFTVVSDTYLKATVPQGATTGYVTVTTPSGLLKSNVPFHVIQ